MSRARGGAVSVDPRTGSGARVAGARKRLLFVFGSLERAGAQLRTLEVCEALDRDPGIDFELCSVDLGPDELEGEVERSGGSTSVVSVRSPRFAVEFSRLLRASRFDVLNTEPQLLSGIVVWLAAMHRVPVRIVSIHNSIGDPGQGASSPIVHRVLANRLFVRFMRLLITRYATHVVAVSRAALDSVLPGRWQSMCESRVIYNGTSVAPFQARADRRGVRREFGWPDEARIVVNVGRFTQQKNHRTILETMRLVSERDEDARLLLIGSGALLDEIIRLVDEYDLSGICALTSDRADIPRLLLASDVFFFPSYWEGLPGAPLEALAAGLPLVASEIPSIREIAQFFPGAIRMAPATDAVRHADHIASALRTTKDRAGAQRRFAATPFALDHAVEAYRALYELGEGRDVGA